VALPGADRLDQDVQPGQHAERAQQPGAENPAEDVDAQPAHEQALPRLPVAGAAHVQHADQLLARLQHGLHLVVRARRDRHLTAGDQPGALAIGRHALGHALDTGLDHALYGVDGLAPRRGRRGAPAFSRGLFRAW